MYGEEMAEEQAGFVEGNGTKEQVERCRDHNTPLYMCLIDCKDVWLCKSQEIVEHDGAGAISGRHHPSVENQ